MNNKFVILILSALAIFILLAVFLPSLSKIPSKVNTSILDNNINYKKEITDKLTNILDLSSKNRVIPAEVCFSPEDNCEVKLINLINSSKKSIDCAVYDISLDGVVDSLISAKKSGKNVRIVSEYKNAKKKSSLIGKLKSNDVNVILDPESDSLMHNKFCVFDDKTVWVGSMNFTLNGNYKNNNNSLILKDKELARLFEEKIDSFFSGEFSESIDYNTVPKTVGNVEVYFCPEDNCEKQVINHFRDINKSIDCMFFSYTLDDITYELKDMPSNIEKKFIFESRTIDKYSEYNNLIDLNIPAIKDKNPNNMHNKFCIIDNKIVMTGSMNLSRNGTKNNDETLVFIDDYNTAKKYSKYFNKYWNLWSN